MNLDQQTDIFQQFDHFPFFFGRVLCEFECAQRSALKVVLNLEYGRPMHSGALLFRRPKIHVKSFSLTN